MKTGIRLLLITLALTLTVPILGEEPTTRDKLVAIAQELVDAIEPGNAAVYEKHLADDFILVDRDGLQTLNKKDVVEGTSPIPKNYWLKLSIQDAEIRELGDVAVLVFRTIEDEGIYDQEIHVVYYGTNVFHKRNGEWKLVVWQYVEAQRDADPTKVNPAVYDEVVGTYEMGDGVKYVVTRRGDRLFGARQGRSEEELIPESDLVYYHPGTEFRKIFVRGDDGRIVSMLARRKGTDLRWTRVGGKAPEPATPVK